MKILCITHADFESPGVIEDWANQHDYTFIIERPYKREPLSPIESFEMLIVMGGPQSPLNIEEAQYLKIEIDYIQTALKLNKKVMGFCLGAQLIGEALGARTSRSPEKELGVYPVSFTQEAHQDPLLKDLAQKFPTGMPVIHWHNDMPGMTSDSVLLAHSEGCPKQVIRYSQFVYGFQCHLEITRDGIRTMIDECPEDLKPSKFTQPKEILLEQDYVSINQSMIQILDRFVALK